MMSISSGSNIAFYGASSATVVTMSCDGGAISSGTLFVSNIITKIPSGAFQSCNALTSLNIEADSHLESIEIPSKVKSIGTRAFYQASSLTSVTFESISSVTVIGYRGFEAASSLTSIIIPASVIKKCN